METPEQIIEGLKRDNERLVAETHNWSNAVRKLESERRENAAAGQAALDEQGREIELLRDLVKAIAAIQPDYQECSGYAREIQSAIEAAGYIHLLP